MALNVSQKKEHLQFVSVLRCSVLIAVKTGVFFGEKSPQTFETRGLINFYCFSKGQICRLECKRAFGKPAAAGKFLGLTTFPKFSAIVKNPNRSTGISLNKYTFRRPETI